MKVTQVGQRICAHVRESDTVARLGGDEFTIILAQLHERGALAGNQLKIMYQPIVGLDTGKIRKAEALVRWCAV